MQTLSVLPRRVRGRGRGANLSCGECRRRKQKCNRSEDGPCGNCLRRYPPVQCIFKSGLTYGSHIARYTDVQWRRTDEVVKSRSSSTPNSSRTSPDPGIAMSRPLGTTRHAYTTTSFEPDLNAVTAPISDPKSRSTRRMSQDLDHDNIATPTPSSEEAASQSLESFSIVAGTTQLPRPGSPVPFGVSLSSLDGPNGAIVATPRRNAELLHFFHHFVVPNTCSVDGSNPAAFFSKKIFPYMIPNMAILMASSTQSIEQKYQVEKPSETLYIKSNMLSIINNLLKQDFALVAREVLPAVIHLVLIEWWWGNTASLWAHLKGAEQMIRLQGGFDSLDDVIRQNLILTDYELACCFERDLCLQKAELASTIDIPTPLKYLAALRSPLLTYPTTFWHGREHLELSFDAAEILDETRVLTLSITSPSSAPCISTIKDIASLLLKRTEDTTPLIITPTTPEIDIITDTIRLAAQVYATSIASLTPLSQIWTPNLIRRLFANISAVSLNQWNKTLGIFFWILLVACPGSGDDVQGRWLKMKMAVAGIAIKFQDFGLAICCLKQFLKVQRWVERESLKIKDADYILER